MNTRLIIFLACSLPLSYCFADTRFSGTYQCVGHDPTVPTFCGYLKIGLTDLNRRNKNFVYDTGTFHPCGHWRNVMGMLFQSPAKPNLLTISANDNPGLTSGVFFIRNKKNNQATALVGSYIYNNHPGRGIGTVTCKLLSPSSIKPSKFKCVLPKECIKIEKEVNSNHLPAA